MILHKLVELRSLVGTTSGYIQAGVGLRIGSRCFLAFDMGIERGSRSHPVLVGTRLIDGELLASGSESKPVDLRDRQGMGQRGFTLLMTRPHSAGRH